MTIFKRNPLPRQDVLNELLKYDHDSGLLTWKIRGLRFFKTERDWKRWNNRYAGTLALEVTRSAGAGKTGTLLNGVYSAHRIIWKMVTGVDPNIIDHVDGDPLNNSFSNLRNVTWTMNARNQKMRVSNTSGFPGVYRHNKTSRWTARICINGKQTHLGIYDDKEAAITARKAAELKYGYTGRSWGRAA